MEARGYLRRMTALMLAEPEASVRGFLAQQLTSDGFDVLAFEDPDDLPRSAEPDVLVLGDPESLERCRIGNCAVIVLGREGTTERVRALERCDDYLTRPFAYEELVARIRAVLRRRTPRADLLDLGELLIDRSARRVLVLGKEIALASKEYALLEYLMSNAGRVLSRNMIIEHVWDQSFDGITNIVDVYVRHLRDKVDDGHERKLIRTVRGVGYTISSGEES